ncbi:MAG: hypothetical protein AB1599_04855 [Planctomycetota bacterium]
MRNDLKSDCQKARALASQTIQAKGWTVAGNEWLKYQYKGGKNGYPTLYIDDLGMIPNLDDIAGIEYYQQRARLRAGNGDLVALTHPLEESYEDYNRKYLGLGAPTLAVVSNHGYHPLFITRNLLKDSSLLNRIAVQARSAGGITVHPFIGSTDIWQLARELNRLKSGEVRMIAPLPEVTELINDKVEFTGIVKTLLGDDCLVETEIAYTEDEVLARLKGMADLYPAVALKMRNYASAMGNIVFESASLRKLTATEFNNLVKAKLWTINWNHKEPICIVHWYNDILASPSSHLWIPPHGQGEPIVEGIFEQLLEGDTKVFAGSKLASLPEQLKTELTEKTLLLGIFLQELGYVGRCSFDTIIHGKTLSDARLEFVECNGRWGGTSLPMTLYKRVFNNKGQFKYLARDYTDKRLVGAGFQALMRIFDGKLYDINTGKGCYVLYNAGCLERFGKFDVMVLGNSDDEIKYRSTEEIAALIDKML